MADESATESFLAQTLKLLRRAMSAGIVIAGTFAGVAALNLTINRAWTNTNVPLWIRALVVSGVVILASGCLIYMYLRFRQVFRLVSYWRGYAASLKAMVYRLENLAYFDPITGLPNGNALERALKSENLEDRCLILMDLRNFGQVNKNYGHWKGDEYLRGFSRIIHEDSRRNEHIYRDRPQSTDEKSPARHWAAFRSFRRSEGGDEFYVLVFGTVVDGLGYLNRIKGRSDVFETMARDVLGSDHQFSFRAGLVPIRKVSTDDDIKKALRKVSDCLQNTMYKDSKYLVEWGRVLEDDTVPNGFNDPAFQTGRARGILTTAQKNFSTRS